MYAKINKKGRLEIYDKPYIILDGALIANPNDRVMAKAGYKPFVCERAPDVEPGQILEIKYVETEKTVEAVYTVIGG